MRAATHRCRDPRQLLVAITAAGLAAASSAQPVRPETGALLGMQRLTDMIFVHSLDDRGNATAAPADGTWLHALGEGSSTGGSGLYGVDGKLRGLQGGFDLPRWPRLENWRLGVMASFGGANADGTTKGSSLASRGSGDGGGIGLYGTWHQDPVHRLGWYADLWGHYAWFSNRLDASGLARADYRSHNTTASVETGYAMALGSGEAGWTLSPQAQLIYLHNHSYNFEESDGTQVEGAHRAAWSSRIGLRIQRSAALPAASAAPVRPYAVLNWWHDAYGDEVLYNRATSVKDLYPKDRLEFRGGANVALGGRWNAWGDLGRQTGSQSFRAWTARTGARYSW